MSANIARHLDRMAAVQPGAVALKIPRGRGRGGSIDYLALTFAELAAETDAWRARLAAQGVRPGDRTLVMVRPGLPLIASAFALFKLGAVPVIVDPGMGLGSFLSCVARSRPRALVGIPLAQLVSRLFRRAFRTVGVRVPVSGSLLARLAPASARSADPGRGSSASAPTFTSTPALTGAASTAFDRAAPPRPATTVETASSDLAAILFTSGSTGAPKGVCYEHGMFEAQIALIRETYGIEPGEVDLPLLPLFALFNPALGMTSVIPEINPSRPGQVDPAKLVRAIRQENVTNSFGSPTLWRKVADYCRTRGVTLPSLRRVLCAGAPVPADLWQASRAFLPNGRLHSPYGATEALPVSSVSADEIDPGAVCGACVGRPVRSAEVRVIELADGPLPTCADIRTLPAGDVGEIIVRGPMVTREYDALPAATASAKIADPSGSGSPWHRLGDCGYFDAQGKLWFCGRQVERVPTSQGTLFTEPCEQVFRAHPRARRCALILLRRPSSVRAPPVSVETGEIPVYDDRLPALVVETVPRNHAAARELARELRVLGLRHEHTAGIRHFFFRSRLPVDVRHNAKIHRLALARWAAGPRARPCVVA